MLSDDMRPVENDSTGNNMKWDSLVLDCDLYLKNGNYALLTDTRLKQAQFVELEGKPRIALAYYLMAYYSDLNGFDSMDRMLAARRNRFKDWKSTARIQPGVANKIFSICHGCNITSDELVAFYRKAFVPGVYQCHLFTVDECIELLQAAKNGNIGEINSKISNAESRFVAEYNNSKMEALV